MLSSQLVHVRPKLRSLSHVLEIKYNHFSGHMYVSILKKLSKSVYLDLFILDRVWIWVMCVKNYVTRSNGRKKTCRPSKDHMDDYIEKKLYHYVNLKNT